MKRTLSICVGLVLLASANARADEVRLTLRECLDRALTSALEIREGRHGPPIAGARVVEAQSEFDHLLSFETSGGYRKEPSTSFFSGAPVVRQQTFDAGVELRRKVSTGGIYSFGFKANDLQTNSEFLAFRPQWSNTLSFSISQPLLRGGWTEYNESRIRLAESDLQAARAEYRGVVESTLASVERAYWNLAFLRGEAELTRQSLATAQELERVANRRLDAGAGTRIEAVQAEAGVAEREKELILAEAEVANGEDLLRSFVFPFPDQPERQVRIVPADRPDSPATEERIDVSDRLGRAFRERPDVLALKERLKAAGIRVVQTENELLPRLDLFGSADLLGIDDGFFQAGQPILDADFPGWQVGLTLEFPIGNRAAKARHRQAVLERSRTVAGFESLKNRIVVEVRAAARRVETTRKQISASRKATAAAEAQFEAEKDRVAAEKSTNYQLLQVEDDLSRARIQELAALVAHRTAQVDLEKATGSYLAWRGLVPPATDAEDEPDTDASPAK